jgi:environmental stress-induced protein Ves
MAWKNGGGTTAEIAIAPDNANIANGDFLWRLSLAHIERDGPFSAFPGIDRTIMLIEGAGMTLTSRDGTPLHLDRPFRPQDFPGEWSIDCRLSAGPVRDLNLMVNRSAARATWRIVKIDNAHATLPAAAGGTLLVHGLEGQIALEGVCGLGSGASLAPGETLIADAGDLAADAGLSGAGLAFAAAIVPH